jgi:hypothetical protein
MSINFPNASRNYDSKRQCIRFLGHDDMHEVSFAVNEDALVRINPGNQRDEDGFLDTFDFHRERILMVASRLYSRGRKGLYTLQASDF